VAVGSPLYGRCVEEGRSARCFEGDWGAGDVVFVDERSLGLKGAGLSLVRRQPGVSVVDGRIRVHFESAQSWVSFDLVDGEGERYTVVMYRDRALARKGFALASRVLEGRGEAAGSWESYAGYVVEMTGDGAAEVLIWSRERQGGGELLVVGSSDSRRALDVVAGGSSLRLGRLGSGEWALVRGEGCGDAEIWRYDRAGGRQWLYSVGEAETWSGVMGLDLAEGAVPVARLTFKGGEVVLELYASHEGCVQGVGGVLW